MSEAERANIPPAPPFEERKKDANKKPTRAATIDECHWAKKFPELHKGCFLGLVCEYEPPKMCKFRNISSQLQDGPTCGIAALSMLLENTPTPEELLQEAKKLNFTNNGEMFSACKLFELVSKYFMQQSQTNENNCELHDSVLDCHKIRQSLEEGACLFVPYDSDFNYAPCLKNGHRAHWALVTGYLITQKDEFYVIARHGKAKNFACWRLKALSDSNANLFEFDQPKGYPDLDFLLPPGGVGGSMGLRERAIIVKNVRQEIITMERDA